MAKRKKKKDLPLFDLPLQGGAESEETADVGSADEPLAEIAAGPATTSSAADHEPPHDEPPKSRGLFDALEEELGDELDQELADEVDEEAGTVASPVDRLLSGLADIGVHLVMVAVAAIACMVVGVPVTASDWPPFLGLALVLSFLYWIIPLAFWGQTPGMAWMGNVARSADDEPLSFGQAVLRWLGALGTLALVGLPLLMALGGRSLSDRLSDSKTEIF